MVNSINIYDKNNRGREFFNAGIATVGAGCVYKGSKIAYSKLSRVFGKNNIDKFRLTEAEKETVTTKAFELINSGELKKHGTKISFVDKSSALPHKQSERVFKQTQAAKNAFYMYCDKTVYINKDFLSPIFHELGHAKNDATGFNRLVRIAGRSMGGKVMAKYLPLFALCTSQTVRKPGEKMPLQDKIINVVRIMAAPIVFWLQSPRLVEEKTASINGERMIKNSGFAPELLQKIKNTHKWGFNAYLRQAVAATSIIALAVVSKDIIKSFLEKTHAFDALKTITQK